MNDNKKNKSSKPRQLSSKAPPQIATFFSKPLSPNNELSPPSSSSPSPNDRKRKLSEATSQNENSNFYVETLQKDAVKVAKIKKTKKVETVVSTFFQQRNSDDLDFESPDKKMQFKTPPVLPKKKVTRKRKPPANKQSKLKNAVETDIFEKVLIHHSNANGLNSDDLQMAIALSRSLTDTQHSQNGESSSISDTIRNAEPFEKEDIIRQTFEKFGFKKRDNNDYDYRDFYANFGSKRKWLSKFTPLTRRSEYMQKQKFKNKVKRILQISEAHHQNVNNEVVQTYIVTSSYLDQFFIPNNPSYSISRVATEAVRVEDFYVNNLVPISKLPCDCLLKNWADIPGRDVSPQRSIRESCNVHDTTISSVATDEPMQDDNIHSPQIISSVEPNTHQGIKDPIDNPKSSSNDDHKNESVQHQENDESYRKSADLSNTSLGVAFLPNVDLSNERLLSPDMFADYESSANNSLNDDFSTGDQFNHNDDPHVGPSGNTENELIRLSSQIHEKLENRESDSNIPNETLSNATSIQSEEKVANVLRSDDLDVEMKTTISCVPDEVNDRQSTTSTKERSFVDISSIATIRKHLSFTDRLELYNSDPALENMFNDPPLVHVDDVPAAKILDEDHKSSLMDPSSQNSIVISDDEINYSLNHCRRGVEDEMINMHSQESIVLSDSEDDQSKSQMADNEAEERQSFVSIEMDDGIDFGNAINSNQDSKDENRIDQSVQELCRSVKSPTMNMASQESIVLSDSDDQNGMAPQLSEDDEAEERQSFVSIEIANVNDSASEKSLDLNIDDEIFNSNQSLNDEELINLSVREMCRKEFVSSSAKTSTTNSISRTTSDLTFERKTWKPPKTPNQFNNHSDDDFDEFDKLVRGNRCKSPIPTESSIEISDDELDKSFLNRPAKIQNRNSSESPTECNEFIVQSMDQIYQVRTGKLVSPKPDYENMDSPTRSEHLKKYGLKTLSKRKAVICLEHIYNRLHPFIELDDSDDLDDLFSHKDIEPAIDFGAKKVVDNATSSKASGAPIAENHFLQENEEVFYLPSAPRVKKPWCLEPLHVAWHNLINCNASLYEAILQYKPVDLMDIRAQLKSVDLRYEMDDIISFLDRKCITFKTDNKRNNAAKKN